MSKLPAGRLARHAYFEVIGNWRGLVRVGAPWLLVGWALVLLSRAGSPLLSAAAEIVVSLGAAAVAVAWHRHLLLGEPLVRPLPPFDARVLRYFVLSILLAIMVGTVPLMVFAFAGGFAVPGTPSGEAGPGAGAILLVPAALIACLYLALRLQLVFPATAIGDATMRPARSWALTRGNGLRLCAGFFLAVVPVTATAIGMTLLLGYLADATGSIFLAALADFVAVGSAWLQAPLIASFLSYAYTFFQQPGPGPAAGGPLLPA